MLLHTYMRDLIASPKILTYTLPVLMLYLIVGTIAQKYLGLYESTQMFFASPFFWLGSIPLPGVPLIIALIFLNLAAKLLIKSPWCRRHSGIIITHIGAGLLLIGGLFTMLFSHEGYIDLAIGQQQAYASDYHKREFVVLDDQDQTIYGIPHPQLSIDKTLSIPDTPVSFKIIEHCRNCTIQKRGETQEQHYGMAQHMALLPGPLAKEDEENMAGATFMVSGSDNDGVYLTLENVPKLPEITVGEKTYRFALRRERRALPFSIELLDFKRDMHPGTTMAKAYQSHVRIHDGDAQWESTISMNEPLRYKGYTFFQSSFIQTPDGDVSVLSAVWNVGRAFPYIAGITMCLGLILHLFIRYRRNIQKENGGPGGT